MARRYLKFMVVLLWFALRISTSYSQVKHSHDIVLGNLQFKDGLNLGLVFNGVQLDYRYGIQWAINNHEIGYQPQLGVGIGFSRFGMQGYQIHINPVNVTWTMPVYEQNGHTIRVGANFTTDYNYQYYEDLHDAPLFWTTEMGFSPVVRYSYQWNEKRINVRLQNSIFGFTSNRQGYDPYFWQTTFKDFFVKPHTDLKFGSFNNYNHTTVTVEYVPNISKKHSFLYEFDYFGIYYGNKFQRINHNLIWRISL